MLIRISKLSKRNFKTNDHLKMLKKLTLSEENFKKILLRCKENKFFIKSI